ncbi:Homeobox protein cut-like 1 [Hypsibius exemplaris]|uniref:Homeobox protein cut-like 1 n=1 Tax=Hypsibius exemplaris TaxID=2072580 RepID=A0A1W0WQN8_HYPEX|nr:Homeobox protein cut-like 1 [Hypsibius exemplaris]
MAVVSPPVAALERWKQLKFQQIQNELDTAAADIAARQEESESGRKRLIELSREFRQTTSEEVRRQVQPLLKSFQTEVDSLVKRSKSAETAFLDVYKTFADLPDPTSIVEYLAHLEEKVVENKQLRETLEEYDRQVIANKAQEAKLTRDQLAEADLKIEAAVQTRLKSEVDLLTAEFAERQAELALEKSAMERKLTDAQDQVGILRRELDRSHVEMSRARMMTGQTQDEKITLFAEDLDRATDRAASAEYKISELEQQVTSLQKQINTKTQESPNGNVEVPVSRSQQNQQDAVQRLRDELDRLKGSYQTQFDRMEDQLTRLSSQNTLLLRKLDAQRDYDEMKQQLSLLKSVNYSDDLTGGSLESILASRNRRLENDNAALRVRESELAGGQHRHLHHHPVSYSRGSSDGEEHDTRSSPSPVVLDDDMDQYPDDLSELELANLTPEMMSKIADAKAVLQTLHGQHSSANGSAFRFMNTMEVADQVNRVLEEEGITRCALAKFVLHGSYKMVYDALHDPRPCGFLNSAGRDKYRKLKIWAEDARYVNAVKVLQVYCKDKRRRSDAQSASFSDEPPFYRNGGNTTPHSIDSLLAGGTGGAVHGVEEPTDLSLPKMPNNGRRKAFQPQRDIQMGSMPMEQERSYWLSKPAPIPLSLPKPSFTPHRRGSHVPTQQRDFSQEQRAPSQSPKRISPQHLALQTARRRESRDSQMSIPAALFRPSASFTASPVALGISFPDYRKNVLHAITDDMINQFDPLDTDVVTRAVRSKLNKCNVSQRLFGEVVLGMSQGAVSDLLKRPKPWNKLTRPTKEHYVRMQQFLDDENSIPVLQAIQNREDPERILSATNEEAEEEKPDTREGWSKEDSPHLPTQVPPTSCIPITIPMSTISSTGRGPEAVLSESDLSEREAFQAVKDHFTKFYQITDVSRSGMLDTVTVASRIKEELRSRNLQQKLIGELVLDVGQGTVSELLNKPKPYGMLSMKGRENYMKLLKLLQTAEDFTLLEALRTQGQQKANANKRTRASSDGESSSEKRSRSDHGGGPDESDHSGVDAENHIQYPGSPIERGEDEKHHFSGGGGKYSDDDSNMGSLDGDEDAEIINGVCVPKSAMRSRSQDTVIVQPSSGGGSGGGSRLLYSSKVIANGNGVGSSVVDSWSLGGGGDKRVDNFATLHRGLRDGSHDAEDKDW